MTANGKMDFIYIAEDAGKKSKKEFEQFLRIAYGSACELENKLIITKDLQMGDEKTTEKLFVDNDELRKIISVFCPARFLW